MAIPTIDDARGAKLREAAKRIVQHLQATNYARPVTVIRDSCVECGEGQHLQVYGRLGDESLYEATRDLAHAAPHGDPILDEVDWVPGVLPAADYDALADEVSPRALATYWPEDEESGAHYWVTALSEGQWAAAREQQADDERKRRLRNEVLAEAKFPDWLERQPAMTKAVAVLMVVWVGLSMTRDGLRFLNWMLGMEWR